MTTPAENERLHELAAEIAGILTGYAAGITQGAAPGSAPPATLQQRVAWLFSFYLSPAVSSFAAAEGIAIGEQTEGDRRAKQWGYIARFWSGLKGDPVLEAETEPAVMQGTGQLPTIVADLAEQMHGEIPAELTAEAIKARLPQVRNNLGRNDSGQTVLRVDYEIAGGDVWRCQVDIARV
ncbi:MAG TPA: hypothetical protein VHJ19_12710 [Gammaproteobacteria bacterium]|nr:hypothetical protein [Gammaproteobacteria bacterium]